MLTVAVWLLVHRTEQARLRDLQEAHATAVAVRLDGRVKGLGQILKGASSYLGRGALPTRAEWKGYVANLDLPGTYPGIQGLGFTEWLPGHELVAHEQRLRKEGFPAYAVEPGGPLPADPDGASAIIYLEPMDTRNQRAFGKNMLREPVRREAMLRARDTGFLALTGPITLYQEQGLDLQTGTLLLAPVYRQGLPRDTVADRRAAFRGWVHFTFRMKDLIAASLKRELRQADLKLFDDAGPGGLGLLFDSDSAHLSSSPGLQQTRRVDVAGRTWLAQIQPNLAFYAETGRQRHWEILIGGLAVSLLLFTLLTTIRGAEARAHRLAQRRGEDLLATEAQFRALFELAPFGMAIVDSASGRFLSVNARLGDILGYTQSELEARTFQSVTHPEHLEADLDSVRGLVSGQHDLREVRKEKRYLHRAGHEVWGRLSMVRLPSAPGAPARHLSIVEDITEVRARGEEIKASEARFRGVFDLSPDPITLSRLSDGKLVMANQIWCEFTGIPLEEALGYSPAELGSWSRPEERAVLLAEVRREGRIAARPSVILGRDGRERQVLITAQVLYIGQEELVLIMGKDVTEQHQTQVALQESEARYRGLFDHSPDGIVLIRLRDQVLLEVNQTWERMTGVPRAEAIGRTTLDLGLYRDPTDRTRVYENLPNLGSSGVWPMSLQRRDGIDFEAEVTVNVLEAEGETCALVMLRDVSERHHAEQALRDAEATFRMISENVGDVVWVLSLESLRFEFVSPSVQRLRGLEAAEVMAQPMEAALTPASHQQVQRLMAERIPAFREDDPATWVYSDEVDQLRVDGSVVPTEVTTRFVSDGQGHLLRVIGVTRDITERKQAEAALLASEARWKLALEAAGDGVWEWAEASDSMYFSPRYKVMLGYGSDDDMAGSYAQWIERIHPEDREGVLGRVNAYLDGKVPFYTTEYRLQRRDGSYLWVLARGSALERDAAGRPTRVIGTHTDITPRKEAELALAESETRFRHLADTAPALIWMSDAEGRCTYFNEGWRTWTGQPAEGAQGGAWAGFIHPEDLPGCLDIARRAVQAREAYSAEFRLRHHSGAYRWIADHAQPRFAEDGSFLGYIGAGIDIQDMREAEATSRSSELRVRKAESLVLMAGGIAHDFNNIFQGVLGFLDIAEGKAGGNAEVGRFLAKAKTSLRKAIQLSWKMLDFSGRSLLKMEPLELERWLPAYLATLRLDLSPSVQLVLSAEPVPSILGDRFKLEEVVKAMLDNAIEAFGPGGGRIRLRLQADFGEDPSGPGSPGIWPLARPALPGSVCLELADDGPGVSPERLPLICDPFFTTREQGRGLGLAVVVGILGAHRAGFHIFNGEGGGLVQRIHFPPSGL